MTTLLDPHFWAGLLQIAFINLLLSGDNAVVIALAVRALPRRQRVLGQIWGTVGAVVLRLVFIAIITALFRVPFVRLVGGLLLVWIAFKLLRPEEIGEGSGRHGASFWEAIWIIIVADVTMSLDNVLAIAAAAEDDMLLIALGIGTSVPIVVWGSGLLAALMNRHAWIVWVGGGLLGKVAGDMIFKDPVVTAWVGPRANGLEHVVAWAMAAGLIAYGWWIHRRRKKKSRPD
jgi:YjbE family integral membrane protein